MTGDIANEIANANRILAAKRIALNICTQKIQAVLACFEAAEFSHDILLSAAETYGVEHALSELIVNAKAFSILKPPSAAEIDKLRPTLTKAYRMSLAVDRALARREHLLMRLDPSHVRVFQLGADEVILEMQDGKLVWRLKAEAPSGGVSVEMRKRTQPLE